METIKEIKLELIEVILKEICRESYNEGKRVGRLGLECDYKQSDAIKNMETAMTYINEVVK